MKVTSLILASLAALTTQVSAGGIIDIDASNGNHYDHIKQVWNYWGPSTHKRVSGDDTLRYTGSDGSQKVQAFGQYASVTWLISAINSAINQKAGYDTLAFPWVCYGTTADGQKALNCALKRAREAGLFPVAAYNGKYQVKGAHTVQAWGNSVTSIKPDYYQCLSCDCWGSNAFTCGGRQGASVAVAYRAAEFNQPTYGGSKNYTDEDCSSVPTATVLPGDCEVVAGGTSCSSAGVTCSGNVA